MNGSYSFIFGILLGIATIFTFHFLDRIEEGVHDFRLLKNLKTGWITIMLHGLALIVWLFIPSATASFFADWQSLPPALLLRGLVSITYAVFVPGVTLVVLLDPKKRLSKLEAIVFGALISLFLTSIITYLLFTFNLEISTLLLPLIWILTSLFLLLRKLFSDKFRMNNSVYMRPPSFSSRLAAAVIISTATIFLFGILAINVSWYAPIGGDLWTHIAQTSYFLQGERTITYPWGYHFILAGMWAITGLPLVNVAQLIQFLTILPVLALYVTVSTYADSESKIPPLAAFFYATFMGLGWGTYLLLRGGSVPASAASLYNLEYSASAASYDITHGVFNMRIVFLPETIAVTALILGLRLLRGFTMTTPLLILTSAVITFSAMASHIFETAFLMVIFAVAPIFRAKAGYLRVLIFSELGAAVAFGLFYFVESTSPLPQRLFESSLGGVFYAGFVYSAYALACAMTLTLLRILVSWRNFHNLDFISWIESKTGGALSRAEPWLIRFSVAFLTLCGFLVGVYTLVSPPFYAWYAVATGEVPFNYYPIRLGILTFFSIMGGLILLMHLDSFRKYFEILSLAVLAIAIARLLDYLGPRPIGFGEARVMDILWIAVTTLAAYGFLDIVPRLCNRLNGRVDRRKVIGAVLLLLLIFTGVSSFLVFVDAKIVLGQASGYKATVGDLQVIDYIIRHRTSLAGAVTSPSQLSQYKLRALTLSYPIGYFNRFGVLPFFTSRSVGTVIANSNSLASARVFVSDYDISYLSSNGYLPVLWFLAYQRALVKAENSFLLAPRPLQSPSGGTITLLVNQQAVREDFLLISALGLARSQYSIQSSESIGSTNTPYVILGTDPTINSTYQSALSWVQATGGTLFVVSNKSEAGLFETEFFINTEENSTFSVVGLADAAQGTLSFSVPVPFIAHHRRANATVLSIYQRTTLSSPLSYEKTLGTGHVILIMLRDYYNFLASNMFTEVGSASYAFLPYVLKASGVPVSL